LCSLAKAQRARATGIHAGLSDVLAEAAQFVARNFGYLFMGIPTGPSRARAAAMSASVMAPAFAS